MAKTVLNSLSLQSAPHLFAPAHRLLLIHGMAVLGDAIMVFELVVDPANLFLSVDLLECSCNAGVYELQNGYAAWREWFHFLVKWRCWLGLNFRQSIAFKFAWWEINKWSQSEWTNIWLYKYAKAFRAVTWEWILCIDIICHSYA